MKIVLLLSGIIMALVGPVTSAQGVYKTVDENGKVTYTDSPKEQSEELTIDPLNVHEGTKPAAHSRRPKTSKSSPASLAAPSLTLESPINGQKIGPTERTLSIRASIKGRLQADHFIVFYINGHPVSQPSKSLSITIPLGLKMRGQRTVNAAVVSSDGRTISTSNSATTHVIRP